jgi:hypothetical protein
VDRLAHARPRCFGDGHDIQAHRIHRRRQARRSGRHPHRPPLQAEPLLLKTTTAKHMRQQSRKPNLAPIPKVPKTLKKSRAKILAPRSLGVLAAKILWLKSGRRCRLFLPWRRRPTTLARARYGRCATAEPESWFTSSQQHYSGFPLLLHLDNLA